MILFWSNMFRLLRFSGARKLKYWLKWVKQMDLHNQKLTRNCSSNVSKQRIIIIEHHISLVYYSCTHQLMSTSSIYLLIWECHSFQFIIISLKAFAFLFRTHFSFIGKRARGTSSILSLNIDLTQPTKLLSIF